MLFTPPRCPNRDCPLHHAPAEDRAGEHAENWFVRKGVYRPRCREEPVPRFWCRFCSRNFSRQTFRHDYRDRKPWCNIPLLELLTSGVGLRQSARLVKIDIHSVQGKLRKFARTNRHLHDNLSPKLPPGRTYVFDEEETFERDSIWPLTMPVLIDRETWFVVAVNAAPIRRLARVGSHRRRRQERSEGKHGQRADHSRACVKSILQALQRRLEPGPLTLLSDDKASYRRLIAEVFGATANHQTTPGSAPRMLAFNPLFPINTTLAMTRDNNGRLRRRSWLVSKRRAGLVQQMHLFVVYRNYVRRRFNHDRPEQTPAAFLELLPRALRPAEVLAWRQDWGPSSIHPMSPDAAITVATKLTAEAA